MMIHIHNNLCLVKLIMDAHGDLCSIVTTPTNNIIYLSTPSTESSKTSYLIAKERGLEWINIDYLLELALKIPVVQQTPLVKRIIKQLYRGIAVNVEDCLRLLLEMLDSSLCLTAGFLLDLPCDFHNSTSTIKKFLDDFDNLSKMQKLDKAKFYFDNVEVEDEPDVLHLLPKDEDEDAADETEENAEEGEVDEPEENEVNEEESKQNPVEEENPDINDETVAISGEGEEDIDGADDQVEEEEVIERVLLGVDEDGNPHYGPILIKAGVNAEGDPIWDTQKEVIGTDENGNNIFAPDRIFMRFNSDGVAVFGPIPPAEDREILGRDITGKIYFAPRMIEVGVDSENNPVFEREKVIIGIDELDDQPIYAPEKVILRYEDGVAIWGPMPPPPPPIEWIDNWLYGARINEIIVAVEDNKDVNFSCAKIDLSTGRIWAEKDLKILSEQWNFRFRLKKRRERIIEGGGDPGEDDNNVDDDPSFANGDEDTPVDELEASLEDLPELPQSEEEEGSSPPALPGIDLLTSLKQYIRHPMMFVGVKRVKPELPPKPNNLLSFSKSNNNKHANDDLKYSYSMSLINEILHGTLFEGMEATPPRICQLEVSGLSVDEIVKQALEHLNPLHQGWTEYPHLQAAKRIIDSEGVSDRVELLTLGLNDDAEEEEEEELSSEEKFEKRRLTLKKTRVWSAWKHFCPYSLHKHGFIFEGKNEFAAEFNGRVFLFFSEPALEEFLKNPRIFLKNPPSLPSRSSVLLLGPSRAGKRTQAMRLNSRYGLPVVDIPKMIEEALLRQPFDGPLPQNNPVFDPVISKSAAKRAPKAKAKSKSKEETEVPIAVANSDIEPIGFDKDGNPIYPDPELMLPADKRSPAEPSVDANGEDYEFRLSPQEKASLAQAGTVNTDAVVRAVCCALGVYPNYKAIRDRRFAFESAKEAIESANERGLPPPEHIRINPETNEPFYEPFVVELPSNHPQNPTPGEVFKSHQLLTCKRGGAIVDFPATAEAFDALTECGVHLDKILLFRPVPDGDDDPTLEEPLDYASLLSQEPRNSLKYARTNIELEIMETEFAAAEEWANNSGEPYVDKAIAPPEEPAAPPADLDAESKEFRRIVRDNQRVFEEETALYESSLPHPRLAGPGPSALATIPLHLNENEAWNRVLESVDVFSIRLDEASDVPEVANGVWDEFEEPEDEIDILEKQKTYPRLPVPFGTAGHYCPIVLKDEGWLFPGGGSDIILNSEGFDPELVSTVEGKVYRFANQTHKRKFRLDFANYVKGCNPNAVPPARIFVFGASKSGVSSIVDGISAQTGLRKLDFDAAFSTAMKELKAARKLKLAAATKEEKEQEPLIDGNGDLIEEAEEEEEQINEAEEEIPEDELEEMKRLAVKKFLHRDVGDLVVHASYFGDGQMGDAENEFSVDESAVEAQGLFALLKNALRMPDKVLLVHARDKDAISRWLDAEKVDAEAMRQKRLKRIARIAKAEAKRQRFEARKAEWLAERAAAKIERLKQIALEGGSAPEENEEEEEEFVDEVEENEEEEDEVEENEEFDPDDPPPKPSKLAEESFLKRRLSEKQICRSLLSQFALMGVKAARVDGSRDLNLAIHAAVHEIQEVLNNRRSILMRDQIIPINKESFDFLRINFLASISKFGISSPLRPCALQNVVEALEHPVLVGSKIYFPGSEADRIEFINNPMKYLEVVTAWDLTPRLRTLISEIFVFGAPLAGANSFAKQIAEKLGAIFISPESIVEWALDSNRPSHIQKLFTERDDCQAQAFTHEDLVTLLARRLKMADCQQYGYVVEGIPFGAEQFARLSSTFGIIPRNVFVLDIPEEEVNIRYQNELQQVKLRKEANLQIVQTKGYTVIEGDDEEIQSYSPPSMLELVGLMGDGDCELNVNENSIRHRLESWLSRESPALQAYGSRWKNVTCFNGCSSNWSLVEDALKAARTTALHDLESAQNRRLARAVRQCDIWLAASTEDGRVEALKHGHSSNHSSSSKSLNVSGHFSGNRTLHLFQNEDINSIGSQSPLPRAPLHVSPTFAEYCPVSWTLRGELIHCPNLPLLRAEFGGFTYCTATEAALDLFLKNPRTYIDSVVNFPSPSNRPQLVAVGGELVEENYMKYTSTSDRCVELEGYCPVHLARSNNRRPIRASTTYVTFTLPQRTSQLSTSQQQQPAVIDQHSSGVVDSNVRHVEYQGRLWALRDSNAFDAFMRRPADFTTKAALPARRDLKEDLMGEPASLGRFADERRARGGSTLELNNSSKSPPKQIDPFDALRNRIKDLDARLAVSVGESLTSSLTELVSTRPLILGSSVCVSAMQFVALHLKANNPQNSVFASERFQRNLSEFKEICSLPALVKTKIISRKQAVVDIPPTMGGSADDVLKIPHINWTSKDERDYSKCTGAFDELLYGVAQNPEMAKKEGSRLNEINNYK